jgi:hypothetical protein
MKQLQAEPQNQKDGTPSALRKDEISSRSHIMKRFVTGILFTGLLAMGANTLMAAQTSNSWSEQWFQAKYGRPSPLEESRLKAEKANTAYREVAPSRVATPANNWAEQWFRAKYGRPSPLEESRLKAEQANTAYREVAPTSVAMPLDNGAEQRYRTKYGRPSPLEEDRVNAR